MADPPAIEVAIRAVIDRSSPAILDSSAVHPEYGRYSILACDPAAVLRVDPGDRTDIFDALRTHLQRTPMVKAAPDSPARSPFVGGWIGFLSYEAGRCLERLPAKTGNHRFLPTAWFAFYDSAIVYDWTHGQCHLVGVDCPAHGRMDTCPPVEERLAELERLVRQQVASDSSSSLHAPTRAKCDFSRGHYERSVSRAIDYIAAGDIFQVNLAQRFVVPVRHRPADIFLRLRRHNPSFYGAYLQLPDSSVVSASPELFLSLRGRNVVTRPIKGTRRRSSDPAVDSLLRTELWNSPKDRAELTMIVDLERNDLGRVCEYGSIRVAEAAALEEHPTVHHLVGAVTGRLRDGLDVVDLLRATFPGGSITGAPKIRAMEIIDELEPVPRGVYCGSIGYIGLDGSATFNIAIRTLAVAGGEAEVYAGGGIVADSVPSDEYDETLAKAAALLDALGATLDGAL